METINRRRFMGLLAAVPVGVGASGARAQAAATSFRSVAVDTSPMARYGGAHIGDLLTEALLPTMRKVFADLIHPGDTRAPVLVARIATLTMSVYDGEVEVDGFGPKDAIEGDGLVVQGGRTLSSTHVLTELSPGYSGSVVTQGLDLIRYESIAYQFAYWLRREMNL